MVDGRRDSSPPALRVRRASSSDYAAFTTLFPELGVDDPTPGAAIWDADIAPHVLVADADGDILGYCYCQQIEDTGYIRNVVVAPRARRRGVGRALMQATAARLRDAGKRFWCLNVKPDNQAALALYQSMGMSAAYASVAVRLPWMALGNLPAGHGNVRRLLVERDTVFEGLFALPRGQLAMARRLGRLLFESVSNDDEATGLAVFDPGFPGAFPFRVVDLAAVGPLLRTIRDHAQPTHSFVALVVEDDDRLRRLLLGAGGQIRHEILHLTGPLEGVTGAV